MSIIEITDLNIPELDVYARLTEVQLRNREFPHLGRFIAESPLVIERALDAGFQPLSFLVEDRHIHTQAREILARYPNVPVYTAPFSLLTKLTGFELTRGMLCAMQRKPLPTIAQVCAGATRIAVLENVMNPTNVGAIFRSAAALHMDAVVLTPACSNPLYRRAIRVSMGTVFQIPWTIAEGDCLTQLHDLGFATAAMALTEDTRSIADPVLQQQARLALVLGSEGEGLCPDTIARCHYRVKIPMSHGVDSLNVAAASAVAFWQLRPQDAFSCNTHNDREGSCL